MITDSETNVVFVANTLEKRFSDVYLGLKSILTEHGIPLKIIPGTLDIWCRDYMPIQVSDDRFVQFQYGPDYLHGRYRHLRADGAVGPKLPWLKGCQRSKIVLDGGNVVRWGDRAIVTDKIFRENADRSREATAERLRDELGLAELIVVPLEPGDPIGHSDGMVCWLGERSLLVNDYSTVSRSFRRRIRESLGRHELDLVELPYQPQPGGRDGMPTAAGNWMNFLRVRDLLIVPTFGMKGDERALKILGGIHPGYAVETVACRGLAELGGSIHCVTWQARLNKIDAMVE